MAIVMKVKTKIILDTEEENTFTLMAAILLVIGKKEKWMVKASFTIVILILSMMEIGKTIIMKGQEDLWALVPIGLNMRESLLVEKCKALDKCGFMMVKDIKGSLGMIFLGEKEECSAKMVKYKMEYGKGEISFLNFDNLCIYSHNFKNKIDRIYLNIFIRPR